MPEGGSVPQGGTTRRLGATGGGAAGVRNRAASLFDELAAAEAQAARPATPPADTAKVKAEPRPADPTPADLVKKVQEAQADRGFSIEKTPDGRTTVRLSGHIDPAVYQDQKLPTPRQELRAYAKSTQQLSLLVSSFETSVVRIQALIATKLKEGKITRAEAKEALEAHFAGARPDSAIPVLRFLGEHPEYKDLFGILRAE